MKKLAVLQNEISDPHPPGLDRDRLSAELVALNVGDVRFDLQNRLLYSTDASIYQVEPTGVVIPSSVQNARKVLQYCSAKRLAVLPRGGGTSLAGQCANSAVVLDLSPLRRMISLDAVAARCVVEPGISIDGLNRILVEKQTGLFFAPDPATTAQATIGGCIGNNAAGARSIRYGRTSENLAAVEVLLADGNQIWLKENPDDPLARHLAGQISGVVRECAQEIRDRFPRLVRRNAGYGLDLILNQLDRGIADEAVNLSGLICGSEGTLAVIIAAALKLHSAPKARGLAIASFESVEAAIDAVAPIVATGASAVELLDDVVLEAALNNIQTRSYVDLLPKVGGALPKAALYVEYQADLSLEELEQGFQRLAATLPGISIAFYQDASSMLNAWTLRKSGEALLHGLSATRKPVTFVEDNAIPIENLSRFVKEFKQLVNSHGTSAAYYAHASVGVLHVRPMLNLHDPDDLNRMKQIAVEVAELARACGGVMSGEHGDGRVRGPLLEQFYGPRIMAAFAQIKNIFDPSNILNPGMIVGAGAVDTIAMNLRRARQILKM